MKFQQLLYVREVARSNLNVSQASKNLYTSQPGISKQIKLLEEELGIELFERSGKHLVSITPVGQKILEQIEEILALVDGIKHAATEFSDEDYGTLAIATTHTQAKFTLPKVVDKFVKKYPKILYGGSVNTNNVSILKKIPNIDGFLIGGASQIPKKFIDIIQKTIN